MNCPFYQIHSSKHSSIKRTLILLRSRQSRSYYSPYLAACYGHPLMRDLAIGRILAHGERWTSSFRNEFIFGGKLQADGRENACISENNLHIMWVGNGAVVFCAFRSYDVGEHLVTGEIGIIHVGECGWFLFYCSGQPSAAIVLIAS